VLAKELLSAQAAGSTRLPIHFDGVSRRRGRRRHRLLPLVGKKSSIAPQPSQPITETHVPSPGPHYGRHPSTAGMGASSHRIRPVRRCASSVVCSTWCRGPRGNEIGAPCVRPPWDRHRARRSMRTILLAGSLCVLTGGAVAQTQGAPSAGAASPGTATVRPSTPPSAPGAAAGPLPTPAPNSANAPSSASGAAASPQTSPAGAPAPGAPAGPDPNLPATASGSSNASGHSARTGKNPINERYADCAKLWDAGTHMTKREWLRTCRRIENRLQNLQVENMDVDVSGSKPRRSRKSSPGSG